jgi:hypothetical protein
MSALEALMNKMIKWINNDYSAQFRAVKEKNMTLKNSLFTSPLLPVNRYIKPQGRSISWV